MSIQSSSIKRNDEIKITVYRGTKQIGGCCTVIEYGDSKIAIDIGSPLPGTSQEQLIIEGITEGTPNCDAVLLTHYHGDHIGECSNVLDGIPIYASSLCAEIMIAYQNHMANHIDNPIDANKIVSFSFNEKLAIGDFTIFPIESDHSAVGSVMFLIEVGGKRILHTGDFRLHGRRYETLIGHIKTIGDIDLLITEGTSLARIADDPWNEDRVKNEMEHLLKKYKYCFVHCSSTNLDRLEIISTAVERGKYFIVSPFIKQLFDISEKYGFNKFNKPLIDGYNLRLEEKGFSYVVRNDTRSKNRMKYFFDKYPEDSCYIYSMWRGYMEMESNKELYNIADGKVMHVHSSGHITKEDLNSFIKLVAPDKIIVIHTENDGDYSDILYRDRIVAITDGEEYVVT